MIKNEDQESPREEEAEGSDGVVVPEEDSETPALVGLCGEINEESLQDLSAAFIAANHNRILNVDPDDFEDEEDLEFFISSNGGSVGDMFAVYDLMRVVKKNRDVRTYAFGKVASAAVVLLAAGTPGKRFISRNTRLMIHHCSAAESGPVPNLKTVYKEATHVEEMMIQALADNSKLTVGEIYNIFSQNTDEYFSAEEALEMGFVDEII
jgi:ATP-dependent Clp protease protease subunit|tara:strand:+ start:1381 stop:2007 length:627 start_codon:yes stop_codon:yes gene_type:complete